MGSEPAVGLEQTGNVNLEHVLAVLRRRALLVLLCAVALAGAAYGLSKQQTKRYTATASLVFDNSQQNLQAAGLQVVGSGGSQLPQEQTDLKLTQLGDMAAKTAARLGHGLTVQQVRGDLKVSPEGESSIVDVAATATSPALAAQIANTYATVFVGEQQNANHRYYSSALALVDKQLAASPPRQRQSAAGLALQARAQSLAVLAEMQAGTVQIAQGASIPTAPSSPKTLQNAVMGAILGLILGLGLAFLLERLDRRIREPKDLETIYRLPLLGVVPQSRALSRSDTGKVDGERAATTSSAEAEAFHLIRAHLRYFNVDRELRTLMVASAAPGDGKTTVARHLAAAAARMGSRVLLIEADLRRPTLARQLGLGAGPGLADVLIGASTLAQAKRTIDLDEPSPARPVSRSFDVLLAGAAPPPNPSELIESQAMEQLLALANSTYELIVIDTPPLTAVSDAFPLLHKVDGVIVVGRVGRNRRDVAERLHETLAGMNAPMLGVVANGLKATSDAYGYSYDYAPSEAAAPGMPASHPRPMAHEPAAYASSALTPALNGAAAQASVSSIED
jgi:capsular exopolysaccharide synthesis family protein